MNTEVDVIRSRMISRIHRLSGNFIQVREGIDTKLRTPVHKILVFRGQIDRHIVAFGFAAFAAGLLVRRGLLLDFLPITHVNRKRPFLFEALAKKYLETLIARWISNSQDSWDRPKT